MRRFTATALIVAAATALATAGAARADDDREPGPWEDVVFLPESALSVLLERDPRGVLLQRREYLDLFRRARAAGSARSGDLAGLPSGVLRCDVEGTVEGDVARLQVRLAVLSRGPGRVTVPLTLGGSVVRARLDGAPATLGARDGGLELVVRGEGLHRAVIDVQAPVQRDQGLSSVALALPASVASRWTLTIPGKVTAAAHGVLFRSEHLRSPDRTRLVTFGARDALHASWREGDLGTDLPPLVRATVRTVAEVGARSLDVTALVRIDCARAPRDAFRLRLPADLTVLGIDGEGATLGGAGGAGSGSTRTLRFAEPFTGSRTVVIRATRALDGPGEAVLPVIDVPGAATVTRLLGVRFTDGLRGFVTAGDGLERLDPTLSEQGTVDALLRVSADARPAVRTERPAGRLRAEIRALLDLADDGPWLTVSILYTPRGDRLYGVDPLLPEGFLPESVEIVPARDVLRGSTPDGRLSLTFPGAVENGAAVTVTVRGRWPVPGWTDDAWAAGGATRDAPLPRLDGGTRAETEGFLGVAVPPGTEVRDEDSAGLTPTAVGELRDRASYATEGLALGWRFRGAAPGGRLRITRPAASVTASSALLVVPAEDHVSLSGTVVLSVQRGGLREVRLAVTPPLGDALRIEGPEIAERRREVVDGRETWTVRFTRLVRDGATLSLRAELPLTEDAAAVVPAVQVQDAAREELEIGVAAAGELDVTTEATGLRDADQAELSPLLAAHPGGLLRAWRAERGVTPTLTVHATRLPPSPLPATFADQVTLRSVIGMDGIVRTRLDARIRNIDRQALGVSLPRGARLSTARVAGKAVRPVRDAAGVLLVPIVPSPAPFDVVLVYEEPARATASAATLSAPDLGVPGNRAVWTVYLPEGTRPVAADGDFATPAPPPADPLLLRWLRSAPQARLLAADERVAGAAAAGEGGADGGEPAPRAPARAGEPPELEAEAPADSRAPSKPGRTTADRGDAAAVMARQRIAARAAERGRFGMDIRLLAAGPALTATRLGPTGTLHVRWRTETARTTVGVLAALLAFLTGLIARRRGLGAAAFTVLALGAATALPIALAVRDTFAWDGAAIGALCFAAVTLLGCLARALARLPHMPRLPQRRTGAAALLVLALTAAAARAGDQAPPPPDAAAPPVYVPYDPLRPSTLRVPERVFLPYARYRELWNRAHPEERIETTLAPVIVGARYAGRVEGRALVVDATYDVDAADGGVVALPPGAAVSDLLLDGAPVRAVTAAPGGATLVRIPRAAPGGARVTLSLTLRWPIAGSGPGGVVRTPLPRVPRATLTLDLPLPDAVANVTAHGGYESTPTANGTRLTAALGPVEFLEFFWRPRGADAAGGRTRFEVDTEAVATIDREALEWRAEMLLRVLSGTLAELDATLPAELQLTAVEGDAVASWTVAGGTELRLRLLAGAAHETTITLRGFLARADPDAAIDVPGIVVPGASADRQRVSVSANGLRLVPVEISGMQRTDAAPGSAAGALAFRRVRTPARLSMRTEAPPGGLTVAARHHLYVGTARSLLRTEFDLTPGPRGLAAARVTLPTGWTLDDHSGAQVFAAEGALRLVFRGATGTARHVVLRLRGPAAGDAPLDVPVLRIAGAQRESADVLVSTAPGLAATVASAENAEALPAERFAAWPRVGEHEVRALAWRTTRGAPRIAVRRETLRTTLRPTVVADLTVLDDRVIVDALVHFEIRGGPAREFRVDAPRGVDDAWVLGDGLREVRREDVDGRQRLTVTLQAATTGAAAFRVLYELPVSAAGTIDVTGPEPVDGDGARAFLLLRAMGEAEVRVGAAPDLETCDVSDLPLIPEGLDPLRVLRFLRARDAAWTLPLELAAHELGELPQARLALVEATTVADRDGSTRTRMEARLFNRARAFLPLRLPPGAVLESVVVAGTPVRPVVRASEPGVVQVPIRVQSLGEESQVVALTFRTPPTTPGGRFDELEPQLAEFPGVPVDATTWRLVLPRDAEYAFSGNLDPVEEVEVAIARAEAYASDVARLRTVFEKGSRQQQVVAAQNIVENSRELKETLDVARARLDDLERAVAEGRIDRARLRASRRKADELAKNIADVLDQVADAEGEMSVEAPRLLRRMRRDGSYRSYRGPAGEVPPQSRAPAAPPPARFETKEGQVAKKWARNAAPAQQEEQPMGGPQTGGRGRGGPTTGGASVYELDGDKTAATAAFRTALVVQRGAGADGAVPQRDGFDALGRGGGAGAGPGADRPAIQDAKGRDFSSLFEGYGYGDGDGDGAGAGSGARPALGTPGLISLEPELVRDGRTYAFRKLESNAELVVTTRTPGLGRRFAALGLFALLALAVWGVRRRFLARRR